MKLNALVVGVMMEQLQSPGGRSSYQSVALLQARPHLKTLQFHMKRLVECVFGSSELTLRHVTHIQNVCS